MTSYSVYARIFSSFDAMEGQRAEDVALYGGKPWHRVIQKRIKSYKKIEKGR